MKLELEKRSVRRWYVSIGAYASDVRFFKTLELNSRFDVEYATTHYFVIKAGLFEFPLKCTAYLLSLSRGNIIIL